MLFKNGTITRLGHMTIGFHNFIVNTNCDYLWLKYKTLIHMV